MKTFLRFLVLALVLAACGDGRLSPQGGTIVGVTAGDGLTGGGFSGTVALNVVCGYGLTCFGDSVAVNSSVVASGSGTLNAVPLWTPDGHTLGTSILSQDVSATTVTVSGALAVTGAITDTGNRVFSIASGGLTSTATTVSIANADRGDITVSGGGVTWTIDAQAVSGAKFRNSVGLSVVGRSASTTGSVADITAAADGDVLRRSGTTLGFGAIPESSVTNLVTDLAGKATTTRTISTVGALAGGGDLSADRTLVLANADYGDITVSGVTAGTTWTIDNNVVTYAKMQDVSATNRFLGRITALAGDPEELTGTQATTLLDVFSSTLKGLAPASGGGTANYLRADGVWATPPGAGDITDVNVNSPLSGGGTTGAVTIGMANGDRGDITLTTGTQTGDTWTIDPQAVTYSKIQNVTNTNRLLGRFTAGAGTIEEATLGSGLSFSTGALTISNATWQSRVTGTCTSPNAIASITSTGTVTCTSGVLNTSNVSGTAGRSARFSATNTVGNGAFTDDGTNATIAGALTVNKTGAALTAATNMLVSNNTATFNTTAGTIDNVAWTLTNSASRSTGTNGLNNYGLIIDVFNGQNNTAFRTDRGNVILNSVSGSFFALGDSTLGSADTNSTGVRGDVVVTKTGLDSNAGLTLQNDARAWQWQVQGSAGDRLALNDVTGAATWLTIATDGSLTAGASSSNHTLNGQTVMGGFTLGSIFNYNGDPNRPVYIRAGETAGAVFIGDVNTGTVSIGASGNATTIVGSITLNAVAGSTLIGGSVQQNSGNFSVNNTSGTFIAQRDVTLNATSGTTIVGGAATFNGTIDVNGDLAKFGSTDGWVYVTGNQVNAYYSVDGDGQELALNYHGYNDGTTRYRNIFFGDGKANAACYLVGSTKTLSCGALTASSGGDASNPNGGFKIDGGSTLYRSAADGNLYVVNPYNVAGLGAYDLVLTTSSTAGTIALQRNTTIGGTLDVNNDVFMGAANNIYTKNNTLNWEYDTNATATAYINYYGYQGGATQFRNLVIADGKNNAACTLTGSTKTLNCIGGLQVNGVNVGVSTAVSGTTNTIAMFTSSSAVGNSPLTYNSGTASITSSARNIYISAAAATAPQIGFIQSGQTEWDIYQPGSSSDLRFYTNGSDKLTLAALTGNATFAGTLTVNNTLTTKSIVLAENTFSWLKLGSYEPAPGYNTALIDATSAGASLAFRTNGSDRMTIANNGDVSMTGSLAVVGSAGSNHNIRGQTVMGGFAFGSIFNYNGDSNRPVYIRAGEAAGAVIIGDVNTGTVTIGAIGNGTSVVGALSVGGDLDVNSDVYFGASNNIFTRANTINGSYDTNALSDLWVNYVGYQGNTTQFRDFKVGDGKQQVACTITGSSKKLNCIGGLAINSVPVYPETYNQKHLQWVDEWLMPQATLTTTNNGQSIGSAYTLNLSGTSAVINNYGATGNSFAARPGVLSMETGTTATGQVIIHSGIDATSFVDGDWHYGVSVNFPVLSTSTQEYIGMFGFIEGATAKAGSNDGCYVYYDRGATINPARSGLTGDFWKFTCAFNGTHTSVMLDGTTQGGITTVSTPVAANTWYRVEIDVTLAGTKAVATINGTARATITTNIPNTGGARATGFGFGVEKAVGTTNVKMYVDQSEIWVDETNLRSP